MLIECPGSEVCDATYRAAVEFKFVIDMKLRRKCGQRFMTVA